MRHPGEIPALPADLHGLRAVALRFQAPLPPVALQQIATTLLPLIALLGTMYAGMALDWWPILALGLPAAAFTVRTFIVQHDCGHGSFMRSRRANDLLGWVCSLFTLTPYAHWRRQHARHHGTWNDLDRRQGRGLDIYSSCLTVAEYLALGRWRRRLYRVLKHPAVSLLLLPPLIFLFLYRVPFDAPRDWRAERRGVYLTDLILAIVYGGLALALGVWPVTAVLLTVMIPASIMGVWLFSVQHHFETTHWARHVEWSALDAALRGSSFLRLPRALNWITGSIGFHHVHHLAPRIPNYRLEACHRAHPGFARVPALTLTDGLKAARYALWDEDRAVMVSFADATGAAGRR
jgi:omega-6 fatty acid desaturase (delta-12 desaturase)